MIAYIPYNPKLEKFILDTDCVFDLTMNSCFDYLIKARNSDSEIYEMFLRILKKFENPEIGFVRILTH